MEHATSPQTVAAGYVGPAVASAWSPSGHCRNACVWRPSQSVASTHPATGWCAMSASWSRGPPRRTCYQAKLLLMAAMVARRRARRRGFLTARTQRGDGPAERLGLTSLGHFFLPLCELVHTSAMRLAVKTHLSVVDTYRILPPGILSPGFLSGLFHRTATPSVLTPTRLWPDRLT
jgi:hypothetical protein